jgi:hypothetical protein
MMTETKYDVNFRKSRIVQFRSWLVQKPFTDSMDHVYDSWNLNWWYCIEVIYFYCFLLLWVDGITHAYRHILLSMALLEFYMRFDLNVIRAANIGALICYCIIIRPDICLAHFYMPISSCITCAKPPSRNLFFHF